MKKQLINTFILLGLIYSQNLLAMTPQEYQELVNSYKLIKDSNDNTYTILNSTPLTYKEYKNFLNSNNIESNSMDTGFIKFYKINGENVRLRIYTNFDTGEIYQNMYYPKGSSGSDEELFDIDIYDQKLYSVSCVSKNNEIVISSILQSSTEDKKILFREAVSTTAKFYSSPYYEYIANFFDLDLVKNNNSISIDKPYEENKTFPYFNEEKILTKLYEIGQCDKELTKKANIEVLTINGWIPQENSWNITKSENSINGIAKFNEHSSKRTNVGVD